MTPTTLDPRTQHRKLAALANFLDDLPHDRFHMPKWNDEDASEFHCGTAACACGWAGTVYIKEGWNFLRDNGRWIGPYYGNTNGTSAFSTFFCIPRFEAELITSGFQEYLRDFGVTGTGITPRMAATRIREVLARVDPSALAEPIPAPVTSGACEAAGMAEQGVGK